MRAEFITARSVVWWGMVAALLWLSDCLCEGGGTQPAARRPSGGGARAAEVREAQPAFAAGIGVRDGESPVGESRRGHRLLRDRGAADAGRGDQRRAEAAGRRREVQLAGVKLMRGDALRVVGTGKHR